MDPPYQQVNMVFLCMIVASAWSWVSKKQPIISLLLATAIKIPPLYLRSVTLEAIKTTRSDAEEPE